MQKAAKQYREHQAKIIRIRAMIGDMLDKHAQEAAASPSNWGYVGDAVHIREGLTEILVSLVVGRRGCSEEEAARYIGEQLNKTTK